MNKQMDIFLAEDDLDDFLFFQEALQKANPNCNLARAANGLECINKLKEGYKPAVIFLDLNMPYRNGLDCLKIIRESEDLADLPVIIYSTSHYIKHIDAAFKGGAHYYVVKPDSVDHLTVTINTALANLEESKNQPLKENFVIRTFATA